MPAPKNDVLHTMRAAGVVFAFAVLSGSALTVVGKLSEPPLRVGDILRFHQPADGFSDSEGRLLVQRFNQFGCVLDLSVMSGSGGSLVVERLDPAGGRRYWLHWAGARTSAGSGDCGRHAEIIVSESDLKAISIAAYQPYSLPMVSLPSN